MTTQKKAQSWSLELIVTISIFLVALVIFGTLILKKDPNTNELIFDAEKTINLVSAPNSQLGFIDKGVVNKTKVANLSYATIKSGLKTKNEVCIYFEDKNGRLVPMRGSSGIGSSNITINGIPCTQ